MSSELRKDAQRMADAIRGFRNLPLKNYLKLRATPEYAELVYAWENYSDKLAEGSTKS
jgi:hypothetical protein